MHLIMDLRHLFADQGKPADKGTPENTNTEDNAAATTEDSKDTSQKTKKIPLKNWGKILKDRIEEYNNRDPEHKRAESEGDIRAKFWKDFFENRWKPDVAEKLLQIDLIKQDIEEIGFDPLINPLLAFILTSFAQKMLVAGLLNAETYKAVHNAVAYDYLADSELVKENTYNILYCVDLYRQPSVDAEKYLKYQKSILNPSAPAYGDKTRVKNIQVFLVNGAENVKSKKAKLNALEDIEITLKKFGISTGSKKSAAEDDFDDSDDDNTEQEERGSAFEELVQELDPNNKAQFMAMFQYLSLNTNPALVKNAIRQVDAGSIPDELLIKATERVAILVKKHLKGIRLSKADLENLIDLLLDRLGVN